MSTDRPNKRSSNTRGLIAGVVVILVGTLFLLNALDIAPIPNLSIGDLWPLILIGVGVWRLAATRGRSRSFPIALIVIGALFLVMNLELIAGLNYDAVGAYWPLILVLVGVWRLAASRGRSLTFPLVLIGLGALFFLIGLIGINFGAIWSFWPLILIAVGILIAMRAIRGGRRSDARRQSEPADGGISGGSGVVIDAPVVAMDGVHTTTPNFVDGKADFNVVMGKAEVDFRSATLTRKPSTLEVSVVMGQALVHVPPDWVVQVNAAATMGESKDTRPQSAHAADAPDLIINGSVVMGSLHID